MPILLGNDGSMDTVVFCSECGREYRGTWMPDSDDTDDTYDAYVEWFMDDVGTSHICGEDDV